MTAAAPLSTVRDVHQPIIVGLSELSPTWNTKHATAAPCLRWLVSYIGGRAGYYHTNPERGIFSDRVTAGLMHVAAGNRQFGIHAHTVAEIYVILRGHARSFGPGQSEGEVVGPLDCLYMPPGCYHGVGAVGSEDLLVLFLHDDLEPEGSSIYVGDDDAVEQPDSVKVVRWADMSPDWSTPHAVVGGHLRWHVSWVGGAEGDLHHSRGTGIVNERIALHAVVIPPGNSQPIHTSDATDIYVVVEGRCTIADGSNTGRTLEPLDAAIFPAGVPRALRTVGTCPVVLVCLQDAPVQQGSVIYAETGK